MRDDEDRDDEVPAEEEEEIRPPGDIERSGGGRTLSFISGLLLGALVGAGVALLAAPDRGAVTRKRLRRLAQRMRSRARDEMEEFRDALGKELARKRRRLREEIRDRV